MKTLSFKNIIYPIIVVSISLTLLQGYFPIFTRIWLTTTIGAVVTFLLSGSACYKESFIYLLVYFIFVLINFFIGDTLFSSIGNVVLEISSLLLVYFMFYGLVKEYNSKAQGFVIYSFIIVLIITAVGSFIVDTVLPGAIRQAFGAYVLGEDKTLLYDLYRMGMSNYSLPHAIPVLIPGVVFAIKRRANLSKKIRIILYAAIVSLILLVYLSGATTALLLSILSLTICFSITPNNSKKNISRLLILLMISSPLLLSKNIQLNVLRSFDDFVGENSYFHKKVDLFEESLQNGNTNVMEARDYHYEMSFNEFISHPILGSGGQLGGHSSILDRIAALGIIGVIPFFMFLISQFKSTASKIHEEDRWFYAVGVMMGFIMCCVKNAWNWEMHFSLFVFLPISILYFRNLSAEKK